MIFTVPFLADLYLTAAEQRPPMPHMRMWGMGGDAVPLETVHRMQRVFPGIQGPHNSYGEQGNSYQA